jgi:hypothetical protein
MYPYLSVVALAVGLALTGVFFVNQMASEKTEKSGGLVMQLSTGATASVALALATLFAMLSFGLYV